MVKIPVIIRPEYIYYIEDVNGAPFMHCDVFKWSPSIWKALKKDFFTFAELHGGPLYACKEYETTGYLKFLKGLGFKLLQQMVGIKGNIIYIYYWSE